MSKRCFYEILGVVRGCSADDVKGAYRKLRLTADGVAARLGAVGFSASRHQAPAGMVALAAASGALNTAR